jgi:selenocysteine lyase/cysteine desulfurase
VRRDKIKLVKVPFPVPPRQSDLVSAVRGALTPRTKVVHICHITNLTGHIFPVREICDLARQRGIRTIVDGAHAFAHFPFAIADLGCDYYGVSLHKWLLAPVGTGLLWMRRDLVKDTWPLQPANVSLTDNIRKFEEIGTHPAATHNAIAEAIAFHEGIGVERKAARLRYLRDRWARRLEHLPNVKLNTDLDPAVSGGIANVRLLNVDSGKLTDYLWERHRILVTPIKHPDFEGIRVTPNVYSTLGEIDAFTAAIAAVAEQGLP